MNLLKTSALNGIAVFIKTATLFVLNKILAVYVGPSGYALIGQFQNFIQMLTTFSGSAINTGVVKYTAEYYDEPARQTAIWKTAGSIVLVLSFICSILLLIFQEYLALSIFHTRQYQSVFVWFAAFLVLFNFNALFLAILNGKKEITKLVSANIAGSVLSLIVTGLLAYYYSIYGALVALSINQSVAFLVTLGLCYKAHWFRLDSLFGSIDKAIFKKFLGFALMALVSALCVPLSQIVIRTYLGKMYGLEYAGYWEAMMRLSGAYLMLVTTTLGVYYLPRLSELKQLKDIKQEVRQGYRFILPVAVIGGLLVYWLRDWLIVLLFSQKFMPMRELFLWQIIGDILKIGSWILAYLMLSKAMTKLFIATEILFTLLLLLITFICVQWFGFEGVTIAYMVNYAVYWLVMSFFVFKQLDEKKYAS